MTKRPRGLNPEQAAQWAAIVELKPRKHKRQPVGAEVRDDGVNVIRHLPCRAEVLKELTTLYGERVKPHEILEAFVFILEQIREIVIVAPEDIRGINQGNPDSHVLINADFALLNPPPYGEKQKRYIDRIMEVVNGPGTIAERNAEAERIALEYKATENPTVADRAVEVLASHVVQRAMARILGVEDWYKAEAGKYSRRRSWLVAYPSPDPGTFSTAPRISGHLAKNTFRAGKPVTREQLEMFDNFWSNLDPSILPAFTGGNLSTTAKDILGVLANLFGEAKANPKATHSVFEDRRVDIIMPDKSSITHHLRPPHTADIDAMVPVVDVGIREMCRALGLPDNGGNREAVKQALAVELGGTLRAMSYTRKAKRNEGKRPNKRRTPELEDVNYLDTYLRVRPITDNRTGELKYFEVSPTLIWQDQKNDYYHYYPADTAKLREEIHQASGGKARAASVHFVWLLFYLFGEGCHNKATREKIDRTGKLHLSESWEQVARDMRLQATSIKRNKAHANKAIKAACEAAKVAGYLESYTIRPWLGKIEMVLIAAKFQAMTPHLGREVEVEADVVASASLGIAKAVEG